MNGCAQKIGHATVSASLKSIGDNPVREPTVLERLTRRVDYAAALAQRLSKAMDYIDGPRDTPPSNGIGSSGFLEQTEVQLGNWLDQIDSDLRRLERIVGQ